MQLLNKDKIERDLPIEGCDNSERMEPLKFGEPTGCKTLVTGATGLLGQHIVQQLLVKGHIVRALVRSASQQSHFPANVQVIVGDIRNAKDVDIAVAGCRYVIHACSTHVYNLPAEEMWDVNIKGTQNVCDAVENNKCDKLVFTSTVSTLRAPEAPMTLDVNMSPRQRNSMNKKVAEQVVLARCNSGLPGVIVNPPFFIGPYDYSPSPFRLWIPLAIISPVRFVPGGGFNVIGASDVARAHIWALENGKVGERHPVVGENISLQEFVSIVNLATGRPLVPAVISDGVLHWVARGRVFDGYVAKVLTRSNYVESESCYPPDSQSLREVVNTTVRWFRAGSPLINSRALLRYIWDKYV
jgi:dihydroflavonol-4-reductase